MVLMMLQSMAIVTSAIVVFILIFQRSRRRNNGFYTLPDWNFFIKKLWAMQKLKLRKRNSFEYLADFKLFKNEEFSVTENERSTDYNMFYGSDQNGNSILLKMVKRQNSFSEVWIVLRLNNGQTYVLPDHPPVLLPTITTGNPSKFQAGGLIFECLQPYKTWRLTYNGLLKQLSRNAILDSDADPKFIKFNFFWHSAAAPSHFPNDWSIKLRASALAKESWRSSDWINYLPTPKFGGYDQFGALYGEIHMHDDRKEEPDDINPEAPRMKTIELNLPGVRQRRFSPTKPKDLRRTAMLTGVCRDGSVYILGAESYDRNMTQAHFGYVRLPNREAYPIDWTDFHLKYLAEEPGNIPTAISVKFKANGKIYLTTVYFRTKRLIRLQDTFPQDGFTYIVPTELGFCGERGTGTCILWYARTTKEKLNLAYEGRRPKLLAYNSMYPDRQQLAHMFTEEEAQSLQCAGGKGASLALMTSLLANTDKNLKYSVPAGFVLSVFAHNFQIRKTINLRDAVQNLKITARGKNADRNLPEACKNTMTAFETCDLEPEIIEIITIYYDRLKEMFADQFPQQSKVLRIAVRSSAVGEDSDDASAAGQNATFLGLSSLDETLEAVKKCWASLYTYQSVQYRRQHFQPINAQMAVVVQIMVPSDCAGVLFTYHPTSGDPSKMLFTANFGLGESVVSGNVDPDVYILKRKFKSNDLELIYTKPGDKTHSIVMSADTENISKRELSHEEQNASCLSKDQVFRLGKVGLALEKFYGNPRDIEWAIYENQIYLLQSRPITTLTTWSNWELLHEFDTAVMSDDDLSTFANVGEVLPELTSPLTCSTIIPVLNKRVLSAIKMETNSIRADFFPVFLNFSHRICLDVYNLFLADVAEEPKLINRIGALTVFGYDFFTNEMHKIAVHRNGIVKIGRVLHRLLMVAKVLWNNKRHISETKKFVDGFRGRYSEENLHEFKNHDAFLFKGVIEFDITDEDRLEAVIRAHNNTSQISTLAQVAMLAFLVEGQSDLRAEHYADIALMLGSCKNIESAEIPKNIEELSNEIYFSGKSQDFINVAKENGISWMQENCKQAYQKFSEFIKKNNHRGFKELDLIGHTWGMEPELVIEMIQYSLKGANQVLTNRAKNSEFSDSEIIDRLKTPKKAATKWILRKILPFCRNAIRYREETKSYLTAFIHENRKAYRHLAELMYGEGLLPNTELIFYLTHDEICKLITKQARKGPVINKGLIIQKATRRMKLFPMWKTLRYADFNEGIPRPIGDSNFDESRENGENIYVKGAPVCEGVVKGRACVINSFSEVSQIQAGDILITYCTDVGWSPFFPILSGLVTELGGLLSHGAVVAREYGLPCIIGAPAATRKIKHGEMIVLNASKGIVLKCDTDEEISKK